MGHIQLSRLIPAPLSEVYQYVSDLRNLPYDLREEVELEFSASAPRLQPQSELEASLTRYGVSARAVVRIDELVPENRIGYRLVSGLLPAWRHRELFKSHDESTTLVTDLVDFKLPLGVFGSILDDLWLRRKFEHVLEIRLRHIEEHFSR